MTQLTTALRYLQQLDRGFLSCGYTTDLQSVTLHDNSISIITYITDDISDTTERYVLLDTTIQPVGTLHKAHAIIGNTLIDYYPYEKDELVKDINATINNAIGTNPMPALKLARAISSVCLKLGLTPSNPADLL